MRVAASKHMGSIPSTEGLPIRYDVYLPHPALEPLPIILFVHGFMGFKDWGPFPDLCYELAGNGFAVIAIDLSLNGIGDRPGMLDRSDLLERQTFSQDLRDIQSVLQALQLGTLPTNHYALDPTKIGIIGHSRGGHLAVIAAAECIEIQSIVTWAAIADYSKRWNASMIKSWETSGSVSITNARTQQIFNLQKSVYDDLTSHADRLLAIKRVRELYIPCLFLHGKDDDTVSYTEAQRLYDACPSADKSLIILEHTGHTFGGSHPFEAEEFPPSLTELLAVTAQWFKDTLS